MSSRSHRPSNISTSNEANVETPPRSSNRVRRPLHENLNENVLASGRSAPSTPRTPSNQRANTDTTLNTPGNRRTPHTPRTSSNLTSATRRATAISSPNTPRTSSNQTSTNRGATAATIPTTPRETAPREIAAASDQATSRRSGLRSADSRRCQGCNELNHVLANCPVVLREGNSIEDTGDRAVAASTLSPVYEMSGALNSSYASSSLNRAAGQPQSSSEAASQPQSTSGNRAAGQLPPFSGSGASSQSQASRVLPLRGASDSRVESTLTSTNVNPPDGSNDQCCVCDQTLGSEGVVSLPCQEPHDVHKTCLNRWLHGCLANNKPEEDQNVQLFCPQCDIDLFNDLPREQSIYTEEWFMTEINNTNQMSIRESLWSALIDYYTDVQALTRPGIGELLERLAFSIENFNGFMYSDRDGSSKAGPSMRDLDPDAVRHAFDALVARPNNEYNERCYERFTKGPFLGRGPGKGVLDLNLPLINAAFGLNYTNPSDSTFFPLIYKSLIHWFPAKANEFPEDNPMLPFYNTVNGMRTSGMTSRESSSHRRTGNEDRTTDGSHLQNIPQATFSRQTSASARVTKANPPPRQPTRSTKIPVMSSEIEAWGIRKHPRYNRKEFWVRAPKPSTLVWELLYIAKIGSGHRLYLAEEDESDSDQQKVPRLTTMPASALGGKDLVEAFEQHCGDVGLNSELNVFHFGPLWKTEHPLSDLRLLNYFYVPPGPETSKRPIQYVVGSFDEMGEVWDGDPLTGDIFTMTSLITRYNKRILFDLVETLIETNDLDRPYEHNLFSLEKRRPPKKSNSKIGREKFETQSQRSYNGVDPAIVESLQRQYQNLLDIMSQNVVERH